MSNRRQKAAKRPPESRAAGRSARSDPGRGWLWLAACVLVAAGVWSYSTSFSGAFIGDDLEAIARNPNIRSLWPPLTPLTGPKDTTLAARPIASLTFAINYALAPRHARNVMEADAAGRADDPFYDNVWGYHAVNLAIHLLAGLALFGVVRRTLLTPVLRDRFGSAATALAFCVSLIWLVHPLHTQAVTFVIQRVESLMGLCYLATLYCTIRAAESDFRSRRWTIAAIAACALGMGTKETMVSAPIMAALWVWVCRPELPLPGPPRRLLLGLAATWLIVIALAATGGRTKSVGFDLGGWTWWLYLRTQAEVIVHYLRLSFWPRPLVFQYSWLPAASWTGVLPQLLLLGSLAAATVIGFVRRRPVALLGAWFFLVLAPSSSVLPIVMEVAAEHRMYLPLAAVISLVVLGAYAVYGWFIGRAPAPARAGQSWRLAAWVVVAVTAATLSALTYARNRVYASADAMAASVAADRPQNAQARLTHAMQLIRNRQFAEAETHLKAALDLPLPPAVDQGTYRSLMHFYLGVSLTSQRKFPEGIEQLEKALALRPDFDRAYGPLAEAHLSLGRPRDALATLDRAIARRPDLTLFHARASWILSTSSDGRIRDGKRAVGHAETAVSLTQGRDVVMLDTLAAAYAESSDFDRAIATIRRALDLASTPAETGRVPTLRAHLAAFEAGRPIRTSEW